MSIELELHKQIPLKCGHFRDYWQKQLTSMRLKET